MQKGVEKNAPDEHAPPAEHVGEVAAEQSEDPARHCGQIEENARPVVDQRTGGRDVQQFAERRPHDERQHQQFVRIERESDRRDDDDQPLQGRQARRVCVSSRWGHEASCITVRSQAARLPRAER